MLRLRSLFFLLSVGAVSIGVLAAEGVDVLWIVVLSLIAIPGLVYIWLAGPPIDRE